MAGRSVSAGNVLVWAWWSERLSVGLVLLEVAAVIVGAAHVPGAWTGLTILTVSGLLVAGVFVIRLSPPRRRIRRGIFRDASGGAPVSAG